MNVTKQLKELISRFYIVLVCKITLEIRIRLDLNLTPTNNFVNLRPLSKEDNVGTFSYFWDTNKWKNLTNIKKLASRTESDSRTVSDFLHQAYSIKPTHQVYPVRPTTSPQQRFKFQTIAAL